MKNKLKSKGFWMSVASATVVLMQTLGVKFDAVYVNEVISAVCALLIVVGVMIDDSKKLDKTTENQDCDSEDATTFGEMISAVQKTTDDKIENEIDKSLSYITDYLQ